jgi:hypothetical protein
MFLEQGPQGREGRRREFAGGLIGKISGDSMLDFDDARGFGTALEFSCAPFGFASVAGSGAVAN